MANTSGPEKDKLPPLPASPGGPPPTSKSSSTRTVAQQIIDGLQLKTDLTKQILPLLLRNLQTMDSKQIDYGSENLEDFEDFGVLVRLNDKICRMKNLYRAEGPSLAKHESIGDSWLDAANYALIGAYYHSRK